MAFADFKNTGQVLRQFNISAQKNNFIAFSTMQQTPVHLAEDINFVLRHGDHTSSEAICESLIYPVLSQVLKGFLNTFLLYSHYSWYVDEQLSGIPSYLITTKSKYGAPVIGTPVLIVVEAKKDDFEEGWGQCTAMMYAAQQLDENASKVYGLVTNGKQWEFATLEKSIFIRNIVGYFISNLDKLYSALHFVLEDCKKQLTLSQLTT